MNAYHLLYRLGLPVFFNGIQGVLHYTEDNCHTLSRYNVDFTIGRPASPNFLPSCVRAITFPCSYDRIVQQTTALNAMRFGIMPVKRERQHCRCGRGFSSSIDNLCGYCRTRAQSKMFDRAKADKARVLTDIELRAISGNVYNVFQILGQSSARAHLTGDIEHDLFSAIEAVDGSSWRTDLLKAL